MLIRQDIEVTHRRLAQYPWRKTLLQGEVDFSDIRLGEFVLRLPSISEYREILSRQGVRVADVTPAPFVMSIMLWWRRLSVSATI